MIAGYGISSMIEGLCITGGMARDPQDQGGCGSRGGAGGYHLTAGSAAVDRGVASGVTKDIDGQFRPQGAGYDLGADEFGVFSIYLPVALKR